MDDIVIEDVTLTYKNFSGVVDNFNPRGDRVFSVVLEDVDLADHLKGLGWPVKELKPLDGQPVSAWHIKVRAKTDGDWPPRIFRVFPDRSKQAWPLSRIGELDQANITNASLRLSPYNWTFGSDSGWSVYLSDMYFEMEPDPLLQKYVTEHVDGCVFVEGIMEPGKPYFCNVESGQFELVPGNDDNGSE